VLDKYENFISPAHQRFHSTILFSPTLCTQPQLSIVENGTPDFGQKGVEGKTQALIQCVITNNLLILSSQQDATSAVKRVSLWRN